MPIIEVIFIKYRRALLCRNALGNVTGQKQRKKGTEVKRLQKQFQLLPQVFKFLWCFSSSSSWSFVSSFNISPPFEVAFATKENQNEEDFSAVSRLPFTRAPSGACRKVVWQQRSGNNTRWQTFTLCFQSWAGGDRRKLSHVTSLKHHRINSEWLQNNEEESYSDYNIITTTDSWHTLVKKIIPFSPHVSWSIEAEKADHHTQLALPLRFTWKLVGGHPLPARGRIKTRLKVKHSYKKLCATARQPGTLENSGSEVGPVSLALCSGDRQVWMYNALLDYLLKFFAFCLLTTTISYVNYCDFM